MFFLLLSRKRERVAEGRAGGGERGTEEPGGRDRDKVRGRDGEGETAIGHRGDVAQSGASDQSRSMIKSER